MKLSVLGTSGDHLGPSGTSGDHLGTIIRRSYRFLIIFHQNMSFSAKTALFKFRMSFFKKVSIETAHQSKKLEKNSMGINMAINMAYINIWIYIYISHINSHINSLLIP